MVRPIGGAGQRRRPTERKGRPVLDLDAISEAALEEISRVGVAAATVTAIAEKLGVTSRALYHYVGNRRGLFEEVTRYWARNAPVIRHSDDWREDLRTYVDELRSYLSRHQGITDIGLVEGIVDYNDEFFTNQEANVARLVAIGLSARQALSILIELTRFADGLARYYGHSERSQWQVDEVMEQGGTFLSAAADRYPLSHEAGFIPAAEQIPFATEMFLDGVQAHVRRTSREISQSR